MPSGARRRCHAVTDLHPLRAALPSALVALDFDGTLAPISPHPDDARPLEGVLPVLRDVRATGAALAVVTGRSVASLLRVSGFGACAASSSTVFTASSGGRTGGSPLPRPPRAPAEAARAPARCPRFRDMGRGQEPVARHTHPPHRRAGTSSRGARTGHRGRGGRGIRGAPRERSPRNLHSGDRQGHGGRKIGEETAAVFYAGDDAGDLPAVQAVNAWSRRSGRPKLAVAVSPSGRGPLAELADVTVPDPHSLISLLRQIVGGRCSRVRVCRPGVRAWPVRARPRGSPSAGLCARAPPGPLGRPCHGRRWLVLPPGLRRR